MWCSEGSVIDRMHKWRPKKYSFVFVSTDKIQKKCYFQTRLVGVISTKTKEYFFGRHLCIRSIGSVETNRAAADRGADKATSIGLDWPHSEETRQARVQEGP